MLLTRQVEQITFTGPPTVGEFLVSELRCGLPSLSVSLCYFQRALVFSGRLVIPVHTDCGYNKFMVFSADLVISIEGRSRLSHFLALFTRFVPSCGRERGWKMRRRFWLESTTPHSTHSFKTSQWPSHYPTLGIQKWICQPLSQRTVSWRILAASCPMTKLWTSISLLQSNVGFVWLDQLIPL